MSNGKRSDSYTISGSSGFAIQHGPAHQRRLGASTWRFVSRQLTACRLKDVGCMKRGLEIAMLITVCFQRCHFPEAWHSTQWRPGTKGRGRHHFLYSWPWRITKPLWLSCVMTTEKTWDTFSYANIVAVWKPNVLSLNISLIHSISVAGSPHLKAYASLWQGLIMPRCKRCKGEHTIDWPLFECTCCHSYYHSACHRPHPDESM